MAIQWSCSCGQELLADDPHAGRKVRCPVCKRIVAIPGTRPAAAGGRRLRDLDEDEEDDDRQRRDGLSTRARLARARIGLGLLWGKYLCFLIIAAFALLACLVFLIATLAAAGVARGGGEGPAFIGVLVLLFIGVTALALFIMPILGAVGSLMCCWLPERSGGRVPSMVACGLDSAAGLFLIVAIILNVTTFASLGLRRNLAAIEDLWMMSGFVIVLQMLAYLLMLAGWILNLVVLKNLAAYVRDRWVAGDAVRLLIIGLVTLLVPGIVIGILIPTLGPRAALAGVVIIEVLLIVWTGGLLAVSFKLLNLTSTVRHLL